MSEAAVTSRRKQQKPSRLQETMNESIDITNLNPASVIVKAPDLTPQSNGCAVQHLAGTILGPFRVRGPVDDHENCSSSELGRGDIAGKLQLYALDENASERVVNIRIAKTSKSANCDLFGSENGLFIRVNRSVDNFSELLANFCSVAEFDCVASPKTTTSSSTSGASPVCGLPDAIPDSAVPSTSYDLPFDAIPPHAIYLPVAYHNNPGVYMQVLGYPQIVIPVAVSRVSMPPYTPSIFVDEILSAGLNVPRSIKISETQCSLSLTRHSPFQNGNNACAQETTRNRRKRCRTAEKGNCLRDSPLVDYAAPLDLSLRLNKSPATFDDKHTSSAEKLTTEIEKRFHCECGVSFNNESTLMGHKKYYCKNATSHTEIFREPQRKMPNRCQQCDYQPASASQLAQHVRSSHASVQAYICQICGYKGYSQRGIRSHLRTHAECTNCPDADLMAAYVFLMTLDSKTTQCPQCKKHFSSNHLLKQHICDETI